MEESKITFYIHIGQPKTGSTAIQHFLFDNRESLEKECGILVPTITPSIPNKRDQHHTFFFKHNSESDEESILKIFKGLIDECQEKKLRIVVLSSESLFRSQIWPKHLEKVRNHLGIEVKIILYLKRQDKWLEGLWKQHGVHSKRFSNIRDFVQSPDIIKSLDWYQGILNWLCYFNTQDLIVVPFEKESMGDDVVKNFIQILGISERIFLNITPINDYPVNAGFSNEIIEIFNLCKIPIKKDKETFLKNHELVSLFHESLSETFRKKNPFHPYGLLSPQERINILNNYVDSNKKIAKLFFGEERETLFLEPWPDPNEQWEKPLAISVERIVPIFMNLFVHQHENINQLKKRIIDQEKVNQSNLEDLYQRLNKSIELSKFRLRKQNLVRILNNKKNIHQISEWNEVNEGIEFKSTGIDPYIIIPFYCMPFKRKALRIRISIPKPTTIQVFYRAGVFQPFREENSIFQHLNTGQNLVTFVLPENGYFGSIRIDPGQVQGKYELHSIELGH